MMVSKYPKWHLNTFSVNRGIKQNMEKGHRFYAVRTRKYEDKLKYPDLCMLKYRRIRGVMIQDQNFFTGQYDTTATNWFMNE